MLKTSQLSYSYDKNNTIHFPDINCQKDEHWLLLGQSGTGKTTLLHLLGGLRKAQNGSITVTGQDLSQLPSSQLDAFRGKHIGIVFQQSHFVASLTVEENLLLAQYLAGVPQDKTRIKTLLSKLNLSHKLQSKPKALSQGEQQRVAIARALVNSPKVILADEPTSALDDENCKEVVELLESQAREQEAALLIVTHDQRLKDYFKNQIILTK
ncbi:MAG: ABC transporter ATP-binding protein [Saprospiraceae bacterium]